MTPRSFFIIVLKIFGLYFLLELINILPQLLGFFGGFGSTDSGEIIMIVIVFVLVIGFYSLFIYLLLFKTNGIITRLNLDRGFSEEIFSFNFERAQLYTASLIIIGGVILLNDVPLLIRQIFSLVQQSKEMRGMLDTHQDYSIMVVPCAKILIALLLIGERKRIVGLVDRKPAEAAEEE